MDTPDTDATAILARAGQFVARQGRPLERARWRAAFEGAGPDEAVGVLAAYQNPDGGFGHGIEPDFWNPESTPIQTWAAVEILREAGGTDLRRPLIPRLLSWLEGQWATGTGLPSVVPGNDAHPHAPWWAFQGTVRSNHSEWNPQAALAGFAWARSEPGSRLETLAGAAAARAAADFAANGAGFDPHVTACFVTLADEVRGSGKPAPFDLGVLDSQLSQAAVNLVEPDPGRWFTVYCCRPSQLVRSADPRWSPGLTTLAREEARLLASFQDPEGSWTVTWSWDGYPEAWPVARTWWRGILAVQNARFLREWL